MYYTGGSYDYGKQYTPNTKVPGPIHAFCVGRFHSTTHPQLYTQNQTLAILVFFGFSTGSI